ncbi:protein-methionine-sulfoxide reductase catalytic subunit MsrP [Acidipila sp. EB88]|uniref:protein-methionine-sulfoxide reductase catalytic subunit MsrP n=1 Tax=Acidipila sp. EB88 TaxID=2305226 RepID=UPI000F5F510B|nr:protein-methionine-sulfoxide reductase catalytic subunit MsrP [Acidipila sp. EB88]RRA48960.1 protein-methionine-sulfoxide reductase catalytic subunit MsrP [Acidipila sp. EB88]
MRTPSEIAEITPKSAYQNRRQFMAAAAATAGVAAFAGERFLRPEQAVEAATKLTTAKSQLSLQGVEPTAYKDITSYNNFYEFGTAKSDPSENAQHFKTYPWNVKVSGLVKQPKTFSIDQLLKLRPQEERIYRFRCVEGWSMVVPWAGYSLSEFIKECDPLPSAKFVQFLTLNDPSQMPGMREANIGWPYSEGLRMDEAMHPLTLLTFGIYGETLPNQDGAPVRLIVPWKYGFKSAKSIAQVKFLDKMPHTTWNDLAANEYGFYSNVNPEVDHPRWSQKTERVIGAPIWKQRQPTLMFNGYADQVASLYKGMDLRKNY